MQQQRKRDAKLKNQQLEKLKKFVECSSNLFAFFTRINPTSSPEVVKFEHSLMHILGWNSSLFFLAAFVYDFFFLVVFHFVALSAFSLLQLWIRLETLCYSFACTCTATPHCLPCSSAVFVLFGCGIQLCSTDGWMLSRVKQKMRKFCSTQRQNSPRPYNVLCWCGEAQIASTQQSQCRLLKTQVKLIKKRLKWLDRLSLTWHTHTSARECKNIPGVWDPSIGLVWAYHTNLIIARTSSEREPRHAKIENVKILHVSQISLARLSKMRNSRLLRVRW